MKQEKCSKQNTTKNLKQGFTLLELLVVVIIIGILASIALPQYKKVVRKSRFAEVVTTLHTLMDAEQRYFLANGAYTRNRHALDIEFPLSTSSYEYMIRASANVTCGLESAAQNVYCENQDIGLLLRYFWDGKQYDCLNERLDISDNDELCKKFLDVTQVYQLDDHGRSYRGRGHNL